MSNSALASGQVDSGAKGIKLAALHVYRHESIADLHPSDFCVGKIFLTAPDAAGVGATGNAFPQPATEGSFRQISGISEPHRGPTCILCFLEGRGI